MVRKKGTCCCSSALPIKNPHSPAALIGQGFSSPSDCKSNPFRSKGEEVAPEEAEPRVSEARQLGARALPRAGSLMHHAADLVTHSLDGAVCWKRETSTKCMEKERCLLLHGGRKAEHFHRGVRSDSCRCMAVSCWTLSER